ncbi:hypothetical protein O6H91_11G020700 [Diphasiastrum complanatum]|uniref:Uncharacterized protein n=1 Tax=Diphasiastrum complanatum TaxID=34168 RepID=A0ACC2C7Z0_DIPCM|nr:hypothetical protein O6H91_11G020700 [Diphasiastrum complanatum]
MSFLYPDFSERFRHLLPYVLWFQLFYAVWQFLRTIKYFRIPYVLLSSLWHGLDSWYKVRNLIIMKDVPLDEVTLHVMNFQDLPLDQQLRKGMLSKDIDGFNCELSFNDGSQNMYVADKLKASHIEYLNERFLQEQPVKFGVDEALLWPGGYLIRRLEFYQAMDHVCSGKGYVTEFYVSCFFDCSSTQVLNQNFLRFVSLWPLILQAKNFNFWSAMLSVVIILLDVFSFWANKVWKFVHYWMQYWSSRFVKWTIAWFSDRHTRFFLHTFLSAISKQFDCNNFVTGEASTKVMKTFPIVSNIRVDKHRIQAFHPVPCVSGPWRINPNEDSNELMLHGVPYTVTVLRDFSSSVDSTTVLVELPDGGFVVEKGWSTSDITYFYGVCKLCDIAIVSPIKTLDAHNAHCCTMMELVRGVKIKKFVVCEFKEEEILFIS